jgi:AcrR family transcriptional regulator
MPKQDRQPPLSRADVARGDTQQRLLEAAGRVFAEAGFQAAKVRDICARARANIAAVNYHFGDKLGLYREVLRQAACGTGDTAPFGPGVPGRTPEEKLRLFVRGLLQNMYGEGRPDWSVRLMTHEMAQPSPAFAGVVEQMIRPRYEALRELVAGIIGRSEDERLTRLCAQSIIGQVTIYAHGREVIHRLWPDLRFTPQTLDEIAAHVAAFSYAALQDLGRREATGKRKRKPSRKAAT